MNNIGLLIKMSRIQQNMKQVTLARGICSTSYLSKIEHNQTIASEDVINLLLERLNLNYIDLSNEEEVEFLQELYLNYKDAVINRNKDVVKEKLTIYKDKKFLFKDEVNFYTFNLYLFRLYLIAGELDSELKNLMESLNQIKDNFDDRQRFLLNLNFGLFYYVDQNYKTSLEHLENAEELISTIYLEEWESADFYNALGISNLSNSFLLNTIEYSTKALNFYKDNFIFKRAIDCYIVIGIAQTLTTKYKNAEENYLLAKKLANDLNFKEYDSIITQNLGFFYSQKNQHDLAIEYYTKSLNTTTDSNDFLLTIFSIIKEYSKQKKLDKLNFWCEKGFEYLNSLSYEKDQSYYYHFNIYNILHDIDIKNEQLFIDAIEHFEKTKDFRHANKYAIHLADLYSYNRKYKKSSQAFEKALEYQFLLKSINYMEEL